jgi:hypothetical protein
VRNLCDERFIFAPKYMPAFSEYKQLSAVLQEFRLQFVEEKFEIIIPAQASAQLHEEIAFNRAEMPYNSTEALICESILFPVLREAWKGFHKSITLWSHQAIALNAEISGTPDYLFAKRSALGKIVLDKPYIAVVEAKRDDFTAGWGQCAVEMVVAQGINGTPHNLVFGIVSNGDYWEFAGLRGSEFVQYTNTYKIEELNEIFSVITSMLTIAERQFAE